MLLMSVARVALIWRAMKNHRLTFIGLRVAKVFVESPRAHTHGFAIAKKIDMPSRRVYQTLARFESYGWVVGKWERQESVDMRPARKLYQLTPDGAAAARAALNSLQLISISS